MPSLEMSADWSAPEASAPFVRGTFDPDARESDSRSPHPPTALRSGTDLGQLLGGRYVVLDRIGCGGMAEVFLARDSLSGRFVAVKLLAEAHRGSSAYTNRMLREAELAVSVDHPNVVVTLDAGVEDAGTPFIVLEALVGETLHDYLERNGSMPVELALPLVRQLAEGLRAVHARGIVHGDIKPKNVFLCGPVGAPETVKLIDFGLARPVIIDSATPLDSETIAGTLEYLSPEQVVADTLDPRSDIYAFGVIVFRWLTGELPFDTQLGPQLLAHQLLSPAPPLSWLVPNVSRALDTLVGVAMRKARENRYPSMSALLADLDAILEGETEIQGTPVVTRPDAYRPLTTLGRRALEVLSRTDLDRLQLPSVA
ncbi:MAG: serine/threonine-protein kinase [Polyangiaceae bacterium]